MKIYASYDEALKACGKCYSDEYLAGCIMEKNRIFLEQLDWDDFIIPGRLFQIANIW